MSWSKKGRRRGYHHGNLREALVQAALDLIADYGPAGFTFAEAARAAGVSPAAPYRHFSDRDALMADIARRGFELFGADLTRAWNDGEPDPLTAFENVGRAYLAFARREPAYYAAMFEARLPPDLDRDMAQAADDAFAVLRRAAEAVCAKLPKKGRPPPLMLSLHVWALSHGIATRGRGPGLPQRTRPRRRREAVRHRIFSDFSCFPASDSLDRRAVNRHICKCKEH
jgi:AcrR family transcriptional regulator